MVSDLHLGEACKEHSRIEYLKRGAELDADLCAFLEHYGGHRRDGRPWRLVLGGDVFDFLQVTVTPAGTTGDEERFGLGTREGESLWKLRRLMERHQRVFVYLADFVGRGHSVDFIRGNHDVELHWPALQSALVEGLVETYFGGELHPEQSPEEFARRIRFHPWFLMLPGLLYVEHGHRFDSNCATNPQLAPLQPGAEDQLVQPISALAIRYFANLERGFRTHDKEHWGVREYAAYYWSRGLPHALDRGRDYLTLLDQSIRYYREHGRHQSEPAGEAHEAALSTLADAGPLDLDTLRALDALSEDSVMTEASGFCTILCIWEVLGGAATLLVLLLTLLTPWGPLIEVPLVGAVAAASVWWSRRNRERYPTDIKERMPRIAERVGELVGTPVVAFGHSHAPTRRRQPYDHRAFYVNTGSFLSHDHPPHPTDAPCSCWMSFVELPLPGPRQLPTPELRRWCAVRRVPAAF